MGNRGSRKGQRRALPVKLTPPRLPKVVERTRLYRVLDRARHRPVVWITAPPGAGKTTLVASYLKARRLPVLWYRLDESDADPSSFFHYLTLAAKALAPRHRRPLPALTPEYILGLPTYARRFFEQLWGRVPHRRILVLDNYQDVPLTSPLHRLLQIGLSELPAGVSAIVLSREAPPEPMIPMEARRTSSRVEADALRLTSTEMRQFVELQWPKKGHLNRNRQFVTQVHAVTQGWVAGAVLFLEHEKVGGAMTVSARAEPPRAIFQYLAQEVMARLRPEEQDCLLKICLLPELTAEMAATLTGLPDAGEVLARLYRKRYFIERIDRPVDSYRLHPLFREFLFTQLTHMYEPIEVQSLRHVAARLFAQAGREEDSIVLLREAKDWPALSLEIIALAPRMLEQGRLATVDGWISSVPAAVALETPWLRFWHACSRMFMNPSESQLVFEQVFEQFLAQGEQAGVLLAWTNVVRTILFQWKGLPRLDKWIERFTSLQPDGAPYPSAEIEAEVADAMAGSLVWRQPANPQTRQWLERAIALNNRLTGSSAGHAIFLTESYLAWLGDLDGVRKGNERLWERASRPPPLHR